MTDTVDLQEEIEKRNGKRVRPLGDRVVVVPKEKADRVTESGIVIPEMAQQDSQVGRVIAIGPGRMSEYGVLIEPAVEEGDEVVFGRYAGTELEVDGRAVLVLQSADIHAVID